jgi:N-acetylornithine carbamoyltransferase
VSATTGNVGTGSAGTRTAGATPPTGPGAGGPAPEPRHLLSLRDLPTTEWNALLESAERLSGPDGRRPALAGRAIGGLFLDPSLRTRTSLEVACHDLGARLVSLDVGRNVWRLEHRDGVVMDGEAAEHVTEAAGVLSHMLDAVGLRCFASMADAAADARDGLLHAFARAASVPVLNLESAMDHPHQGLADALTLRRRIGRRARIAIRWAPHVRALPMAVPHAALMAFTKEGHDVVLAHPEGYELDEDVCRAARGAARAAGGSLEVVHDRDAARAGAEVVYVKSWGARRDYGDAAAATAGFDRHRDWMLTGADLGTAWFMHCLPVRRNVVVADEVLDGPRSLVLEQAAARVDVQKASLCRALEVTP